MILHVVFVPNAMPGRDAIAVFSDRVRAERYKEAEVLDGFVAEVLLAGDCDANEKVYIAERYEPASDLHDFVGLYADFGAAKHAAGDKGLARSVQVNPKPASKYEL